MNHYTKPSVPRRDNSVEFWLMVTITVVFMGLFVLGMAHASGALR